MENIQLSNILHIQEASKQGKLVMFVGAGVSANSGVPMWSELIQGLKKELPDSLKNETDDLKIAQLYKDSRGYKEYIEKIKELLLHGKIAPNPIHDAILELAPCHIITTNYDDLIEQNIEQKFMQYHIIRKDEDLPYTQYQNMLIKMHGDFNVGNIVLTENDYYNYNNNFPLINAFVKSLFASKLILFIGFSFNDMNLKILLNSVSNILKENMQRIYLLTNKDIDSIQRNYYEKKGINIVELTPEFVNEKIKMQSINIDDIGLTSQYGIALYKQLVLIKQYRQENDLIDYLYKRIKSYEDEIKVLGNGLKYIFPEEEISFWNYHSSGLQIHSPYIKNLTKKLQTYTGRKEFINKYNGKIFYLRKQAYLNRIFKIDNLKIVNTTFYRKLKKLFPTTTGIELFYELDYINLSNYLKKIRHQVKKYNIEDLELPYLLYKLDDYYQAYLMYKDLANENWKKQRYILYFICMHNIHAIRYGIKIQLMNRSDIDHEKIVKDIERIDLQDVLIKLPIDKSIKHVLEDLLSYRFHSINLVESDILKEDLSGQRVSAEKGGFSSNSKIFLLEHKSYQELDFCNENFIWSSTLPINNRSYFYPSISGSFIFTELMENKDILNYGKIRLSYANVGSDEDPYNLAFKYTPASTYFLQYLGNVNTFPHMGLVGFTGPRVLPNENLKPQNQSSFEVGADLRFFGGKIRLDMTYYSNITKNQIVSIDVPLSTGYFANNINAGKIANKGVEVTLGLTPVETRNLKWDLDATFASNKQTVEELAEGLDEYTLTSGLSGLQIKAAKGDSFGLYGTAWKRDDQGNYVINSKTGLRETVNNVRLGDVYPDFTMGINNTLTYKGLTFSFLIDIRHGGSLYSETVANLRSSGLAAETVAHREDASFIEPGVILQDDGTYRPNDVPVKSMQDYWQHVANSSNNEGNIYNASFVKLREVQLSYSFPRKWFKSFFVKSLDLGFEARNLWIIKDHVPHIDPEANFFGPSQIGGGVEFNSIPSTRSFGFNLRLTL